MSKYDLPDDGTVVDGKILVYLPQGAAPRSGASATEGSDGAAAPRPDAAAEAASRAELARMQAAALSAAAEKGVPFCAECEQARRELAKESAPE